MTRFNKLLKNYAIFTGFPVIAKKRPENRSGNGFPDPVLSDRVHVPIYNIIMISALFYLLNYSENKEEVYAYL